MVGVGEGGGGNDTGNCTVYAIKHSWVKDLIYLSQATFSKCQNGWNVVRYQCIQMLCCSLQIRCITAAAWNIVLMWQMAGMEKLLVVKCTEYYSM